MLAKSLSFLAGADSAGIVLGAKVPIILTSRADSVIARLASCAVAVLVVAGAARERGEGNRVSAPRQPPTPMTDAIVVVNAGSSSIKFSLFAERGAELALVAGGQVEGIYTAPHFVAKDAAGKPAGEKQWEAGAKLGHEGALAHIIDWLKATHGNDHRLAAVGHRVVHGGTEYAAPVRVDAAIVAKLEKLVPLAPLHQPHNLAPIRALLQRAPELPQVACFDTAMHRSNPPVAQMFALPKELDRRRRTPLRVSRTVIRVHRVGAVALRRARRARQDRRAPSRQRREHVRAGCGQERCEHDGLHRGRRTADGHALRRDRPGGDPVPDGRAQARRAGDREADLQPVGPARRVRGVERHAGAARVARPAGEARGRSLPLPDRPRARLARGRARRPRRDRLHRRHRRARGADPRARLPAGGLARRRARPAANAKRGPRHLHRRRAVLPPG